CMAANLGRMESAWAAVPAAELPNSPPRMTKGWFLTMSCPVSFIILTCGRSWACTLRTARANRTRFTHIARRTIFTRAPGEDYPASMAISAMNNVDWPVPLAPARLLIEADAECRFRDDFMSQERVSRMNAT